MRSVQDGTQLIVRTALNSAQLAELRKYFYPLSQANGSNDYQHRGVCNLLKVWNADKQDIQVQRDSTTVERLDAYGIPTVGSNKFGDPKKPVMVMFHGNGNTLYSMVPKADLFRKMGFQVLVVTMGGYPGSDSKNHTSEISTYQDVNAVKEYLDLLGIEERAVYGYSMGGSLAGALAELDPKVKSATFERTFNKAREVGFNMVSNINPLFGLGKDVIKGGIDAVFPRDQEVYKVNHNNQPYVTDGLDTERKVRGLKDRNVHVFVIKGKQDNFMGKYLDEKKGYYVENLGDDLLNARYGKTDQHVVELDAGHCSEISDRQLYPLTQELNEIFFKAKDVNDIVNTILTKYNYSREFGMQLRSTNNEIDDDSSPPTETISYCDKDQKKTMSVKIMVGTENREKKKTLGGKIAKFTAIGSFIYDATHKTREEYVSDIKIVPVNKTSAYEDEIIKDCNQKLKEVLSQS